MTNSKWPEWLRDGSEALDEALVREWLDYGAYSGIGQWRNSGKGRFTWEEIAE